MPEETEITEMTEFDATRVDLVPQGANGFPFLVVKSIDDDEVEKADGMSDPVIPEVPMAAVTGDEPGSPAWEAEDAANLTAASEALVQVAARISAASDRESAEGEWRSSYRLDDALCAVEAALGIVAALSYVEAREGDAAKALPDNAAEILGRARTTLTELIGENDASQEDIVNKSEIEALVDERVAALTGTPAPAAKADEAPEVDETVEVAEVEKADDAPEVDEAAKADDAPEADAEIVPVVEEAEKAADTDEAPVAEEATKAADAPADEPEAAAAAKAVDAPEEIPLAEVLKSAVAEALKEALDPVAASMKGLEERIETVEKQPATGGPFLNGSPYAQVLRSVPEDGEPADVQKALDAIPDPALRAQVAREIAVSQATKVYGG